MNLRAREPPRTSVRLVRGAGDVVAARMLFLRYRQWLVDHRAVSAFSNESVLLEGLRHFDTEVERLPGEYVRPRGALVLAWAGAEPVGCGALRPMRRGAAEIKRLYVRPEHRGAGFGRRITRALLNRARKLGYRRVVLDTLPGMTAAIRIYRSMGFAPIRAYWAHPYPDALFFEYRLNRTSGARAPSSRRRARGRPREDPNARSGSHP
jgi:putative acetyltransferase